MLRIAFITLLVATNPASAEGITLQELGQANLVEVQSAVLPCEDWAADMNNKETQAVDTWQGMQVFFWRMNWANEHQYKLYRSLDGHTLVVKVTEETGDCTMEMLKL